MIIILNDFVNNNLNIFSLIAKLLTVRIASAIE